MKTKITAALFVATALLMFGCGLTIGTLQDYNNIPMHRYDGKTMTLADAERAIQAGAAVKGWRAKTVSPGHIVASVDSDDKKFGATIDILYTDHDYSIRYQASYGLKYDKAKGKIHKHYGFWIENLEEAINQSVQLETPGN